MYLKEKKIKVISVLTVLLLIAAVFFFLTSAFYIVSEFVYYRDTPEDAWGAVDMKQSIISVIISIIVFFAVAVVRSRIAAARFYSSYFEGDLDGYVKYSDLSKVTGTDKEKVYRELKKLHRSYMKGFSLTQDGEDGKAELHSKTAKCQCRQCGAPLEKRIYFTGECPYCGSSDLFAQVLSGDRFYSISTEIEQGRKKPEFYSSKRNSFKFAAFLVLAVLGLSICLIMLCMVGDNLSLYFSREYQKKMLLSSDNHFYTYEQIQSNAMDLILFGTSVFAVLLPLAISRFRKTMLLKRAKSCAEFFSACQTPFIQTDRLPDNGITSQDKEKKLNGVRKAIRYGYLKHCTLEMHNDELQAVLAKKIVKDLCPSCGASIVGAADENYKCSYCGNQIMDVIIKK